MTTHAKLSNEDIINTTVDLVDTGLTILEDVSSVLGSAPLVGPIFDVVKKIVQIRTEMKQNKKRCQEIITKVVNFYNDLVRCISEIVQSGAQDSLTKLEGYLGECKDTLSSTLTMLEQYALRSRFSKFTNRGLDDLIAVENRINDLNDRLSRNILFDIRITQAVSAPSAGELTGFNESTYVLPGKPELMIERQTQVDAALSILLRPAPTRIAIIGGGGFGKTTLAKMILHDPKIAERYQLRYFLDCVGKPTANTLLQGFGSILRLKEATSTILASAHHRLETSTTLLCLDNFETPWEPSDTRGKVEDILETIAAIPNLSLIITLRGEQRPVKPMWSTPLLPPLSTLSLEGSQSMLQSIASDHKINDYTLKLLEAIDGIPLAIRLVSTLLRDGESSESLWRQWCKNHTEAIRTGGNDRESNLNRSISLSVYSPRMNEDPVASRQLLALLSLLPEGFPADANSLKKLAKHLNSESVSLFPTLHGIFGQAPNKQRVIKDIDDIVKTLRQVALIRIDEGETFSRFKMLSPIRLYCRQSLSKEIGMVLAKVVNYYMDLLFEAGATTNPKYYHQVAPEIKNIHSVFQKAFTGGSSKDVNVTNLIHTTIILTRWSIHIGYYAKDTIQMALSRAAYMPELRARCLTSAGNLYQSDDDTKQAEKYYRDAMKWSKLAFNSAEGLFAQTYLGYMYVYMGRVDEAEIELKASLQDWTRRGNSRMVSDVRNGLGKICLHKGLYSEAEASLMSTLEDYKQFPSPISQLITTLNLAMIHIRRDSLIEAEKFAILSWAVATYIHFTRGEANALRYLGHIYSRTDQLADATSALEKAARLFKQGNSPDVECRTRTELAHAYVQLDQLSIAEELLTDYIDRKIPWVHNLLGWLYICGGRLDKAERHLKNAVRYQETPSHYWIGLTYLSMVYLKSGQVEYAKFMVESFYTTSRPVEMVRLWILGDCYIAIGQLDNAEAALNAAMTHAMNYHSSYQQGNILRSMGILNAWRGRIDVAIEKFQEALEFHRKAQWVSEQAADLEQLGEAYKVLGMDEEAETKFEEAKALMDTVAEARTLS